MQSVKGGTNETDEPTYKTYIFGGTINHGFDTSAGNENFNNEFLQEQPDAVRRVIEKKF